MSCVVGYLEEKEGQEDRVGWIAADSKLSSWRSEDYDSKALKIARDSREPRFLFGGCGSPLAFNLMMSKQFISPDDLDMFTDRENGWLVDEFFYTKLPINLISILDRFHAIRGDCVFLSVYNDSIYSIQSDFSVFSHSRNFAAIGSGGAGVEATLTLIERSNPEISPLKKLFRALDATQKVDTTIGEPFYAFSDDDYETTFICLDEMIMRFGDPSKGEEEVVFVDYLYEQNKEDHDNKEEKGEEYVQLQTQGE